MTSPAAILDMIRREQVAQPRVAIVTAVSSSPESVTVRFVEGGDPFTPALAEQNVLPPVGARCVVMPTTTQWVYLATITDPNPRTQYQVLRLDMLNNWFKQRRMSDGVWVQQSDFSTSEFPTLRSQINQGIFAPEQGGAGEPAPVNPPLFETVQILNHDMFYALDAIAALGGTVQMVELTLTRRDESGSAFVAPVMYGHLYDEDNPPNPATAPSWVPGFGPLRLAPFATGQTARWVLPATWVTAMATGQIRGIGFRDPSTTNRFYSFTEDDENAFLRITLTAPIDIFGG